LTTLIIIISVYLAGAFVTYHLGRFNVEHIECEDAIVWPIYAAIGLFIGLISIPFVVLWGMNWLFGKVFGITNGLVDRLVDSSKQKRQPKVKEKAKVEAEPQVLIQKGAILGSEEYRRLKPMIEKYEAKLHVCERE